MNADTCKISQKALYHEPWWKVYQPGGKSNSPEESQNQLTFLWADRLFSGLMGISSGVKLESNWD